MAIQIPLDVLSLPYSSRRMIVVANDDEVLVTRKAKDKIPDQSIDWGKAAKRAVDIITPTLGVGGLAIEGAVALIRLWGRAGDSGLPLLLISRSEADHLQFAPGHPRNRVLYIGHPASPKVYYVTSEFHRAAFEHKFVEAVRLLTCLGAKSMKVECVKGWSHDFSVRLSVPLGQATETATAEAGLHEKVTGKILFEATLKGIKFPHIPTDLVWYPHEHTWQMISQSRLDAGLSTFSLSVVYEDDFGVNAGLKVSAGKAGLDLGGKFEDHEATVWKISGTFTEPEAG